MKMLAAQETIHIDLTEHKRSLHLNHKIQE